MQPQVAKRWAAEGTSLEAPLPSESFVQQSLQEFRVDRFCQMMIESCRERASLV
jgi:hypothetical protein